MMNTTNNRILKFERIPSDTPYKGYLIEIPLHGIYDYNTNLWKMRYNAPAKLPSVLEGKQFTKFSDLQKYAEDYFSKRQMRLKEVIDVEE